MENIPDTNATEKDSEYKKSKKKKSAAIGAFIVKPNQRRKDKKPSPESKPAQEDTLRSEHTAVNKKSEQASESDAPLESLSDDERTYAIRNLVQHSMQEKQAPASVEESAAAEAITKFHDEILKNGQDLEAAEAAVLQDLGLEHSKLDDSHAAKGAEAQDVLGDNQNIKADQEPIGPQEFSDEPIILNSREAHPDDARLNESVAGDGSGQGSNGGGRRTPGGRGGSGGGTRPPFGSGGQSGRSFGFSGNKGSAFGRNLYPNQAEQPERVIVDQGNAAGAALVGGLIGYFIGRRGGRIKTEIRLLPVQKKLQKEVTNLQWQLRAREGRIRHLASEQVRASRLYDADKSKLESQLPLVAAGLRRESNQPHRLERRKQVVVAQRVERLPNIEQSLASTEAKKLKAKHEARDHLGQMIITAESKPQKQKAVEKIAPTINLSPDKHIETLNRNELMRLSEKIIVDGSSLRQIYETKLVGEKGLRRLVKEHLRGGDIKKVLRREIVEREIDFERDPLLRDQSRQADPVSSKGGRTATSLQQLLKHAEEVAGPNNEEVAFLKARASYESREQAREKQKRRLMDISLVTTIAILMGAVIALVLRHS